MLIPVGWEVVPLRGYDGVQQNGSGAFYTDYTVGGTAAVRDIDGDGKLELIIGGADNNGVHAKIYVWKLANSSGVAPWPMFHRNARHTGLYAPASVEILPTSLAFAVPVGSQISRSLRISDPNGGSLRWVLQQPWPEWLSPLNTTGTTPGLLSLTASGSYPKGTYLSGSLTLTAEGVGSKTVPVSLLVPNSSVYLPQVQKNSGGL
ncbi:MAG: FG-GAP repeat protein [Candidatus Marsarchaeota archaeon]|nr:FG-GAP repeat protein [Candidatus Marsarchaeota archaeon]